MKGLPMKWIEIRHQYPDKFILIGDVEEERIADDCFRVIGGNVLMTTDEPRQVFSAYKEHKKRGENVLYCLPTTPDEFIVEEKPFLGVLQ